MPPEKGGQPKDFELGLLNYPWMKNGKGHRTKLPGRRRILRCRPKSPNAALALALVNTLQRRRREPLDGRDRHTDGDQDRPGEDPEPDQVVLEEFGKVNKARKWIT